MAQAGNPHIFFTVDIRRMRPGMDDEFMIDDLIEAADRRIALFKVDDGRIIVEHLTDRESDDLIVHADGTARRLEDFPVIEDRFDGMAFAQEFIIFVTGFVLVVPGFFRSQTFIEDVFRNGDVFPVAEIQISM